MKDLGKNKNPASWLEVGERDLSQRIDNYLLKTLKGVPKSHVYRILRSGEVRVNSKRVQPTYRLRAGDKLRLPPVRLERRAAKPVAATRFPHAILLEDEALLVVDKPAGVAVHGGSGVSLGVIEQLRAARPQAKFLELAHRLDRETSGILLIAKKRSALTELHRQMRAGTMKKYYLVLVHGDWPEARRSVTLPLRKYSLASGERRVSVNAEGKMAHTLFTRKQSWKSYSLLEAELKTGRTHQIRVHLTHLGYPIAGDDKYGDFALNRELRKTGLKRMFLHARRVIAAHPLTGERLDLVSPLPIELEAFMRVIETSAEAGLKAAN